MTRKTRLYQKRKVADARDDIERALGRIALLHDEFVAVHPDHAGLLEAIAKSLLLSQQMLEDFWRISWGMLPSNWDAYLTPGRSKSQIGK